MTSAEEDLINQVGRVTRSVGNSQPFSLASPSLPRLNKVAMLAGMEVMHGLGNTNSHSLKLT